MSEIKMIFFCGYNAYYADGTCKNDAIDSAALPAYSLTFPAGNVKQKTYGCSQAGTFDSGSYERVKLDFICTDKTEGINTF